MALFSEIERLVVNCWLERIDEGLKARTDFDRQGDLLWKIYTETDASWLQSYISDEFNIVSDQDDSRFPMRADKVTELIDVYGPQLYNQDPHRTLTPRAKFDTRTGNYWIDPQEQSKRKIISSLCEHVLNYMPREYGAKKQARMAIIEGFIRGRGVVWLDIAERFDGALGITSRFDTVKRLVIDPNAESFETAQWIARLIVEPSWKTRQKFGMPDTEQLGEVHISPGGEKSGGRRRHEEQTIDDPNDNTKYTKDVFHYWEVWSRVGLGGRFEKQPDLRLFEKVVGTWVGDNVRLCIPVSYPERPLNFPYSYESMPAFAANLRWPVELWQDNMFPASCLDFHPITHKGIPRSGYLWPRSHLQSVTSEILLLSFLYSRLAHKAWWNTREMLALSKELAPDVEKAIKEGGDLTVLKLNTSGMQNIDTLIKNIQNGQISPDLYRIIQFVEQTIERRTGLSELQAGIRQQQMRTRDEAQLMGQIIRVRPDDMAATVEDWQREIAVKEYHSVRRILRGKDVIGIVGNEGALLWEQAVATESVVQSAGEYECRIEAGSGTKPDKAHQVETAQHLLRNALPTALQWAQLSLQTLGVADVGLANSILSRYYDAMDVEMPDELLLKPVESPAAKLQAMTAHMQLQQLIQQGLQPPVDPQQQQQQAQQQAQMAGAPPEVAAQQVQQG